MTSPDIAATIREELARIAPEVDLDAVDPRADLQEACDIDSKDFLNLIAALHRRLDIDIPETDYPELATLDRAEFYLRTRLAAGFPGKASPG
ncbi:acyl carrier protein [Chelatococcus sp. SYSU_G07232]|uniref:Acyl carrier protein n=1 Tax=Chelatococcus albus TaxID=3047466 RepID=A0ABT7ABA4_9HYPH|nr:acyl carrier protein [Chelatococcus sp. SYSU_G07232]MDJ1156643.1 acyl carrier protein [Chelatococcus sp. SYSU_G07232]